MLPHALPSQPFLGISVIRLHFGQLTAQNVGFGPSYIKHPQGQNSRSTVLATWLLCQ